MINAVHVCEPVHKSKCLLAKQCGHNPCLIFTGLPGHAVYNRVRNASELLEMLLEFRTLFEPAWTSK